MSKTNNLPLIQSYLFFSGRCAEAVEFYRQALGAWWNFPSAIKKAPNRRRPA